MKARKISLILVFALFVSAAIAQTVGNGKTSIAILGGVNFQNLNGENLSGDKLENDLIIGYHFGVNAQIPVAPEFYFQPGLLFSTKGAKSTISTLTNTTRLSYIELPLNFVYKGLLGSGYFMIGLGPYVGYGIVGKALYEDGSVSSESDIKFKKEVVSGDPLTTTYLSRQTSTAS